MMSVGLAYRCVAHHTRGVLGRRLDLRPGAPEMQRGGFPVSRCRRWRSDDRGRLALIRLVQQGVEKPRVDHQKPASCGIHVVLQLSRRFGSAFCLGTFGNIARGSEFLRLHCVAKAVRWVHGAARSREKGHLGRRFAAGSSHRPELPTRTPGGLMGVIPHVVLPPRVLVVGRL